jgi:diphthine-ammonia ligase
MQVMQQGYKPGVLLNMMNEHGKVSRSHGLPVSLLQQQAHRIGIPVVTIPTSWNDYEKNFVDVLVKLKADHDVEAMVFGDIDLQAHRDWEEMVCAKSGLTAILPLWQQNRKELLLRMLDAGLEAVIVSCNDTLGQAFLGRKLSLALIPELEEKGVDVCGENGEFHTVVTNCPLFSEKIILPAYQTVQHENYHFIQW